MVGSIEELLEVLPHLVFRRLMIPLLCVIGVQSYNHIGMVDILDYLIRRVWSLPVSHKLNSIIYVLEVGTNGRGGFNVFFYSILV